MSYFILPLNPLKTLARVFIITCFIFGFNQAIAQSFQRVEDLVGLGYVTDNNGVAVADYDQDGDLDVFLVGYWSFDLTEDTTWSRLLQNNGDATFTDVTMAAGFDAQFVNTGVKAARGEKMGVAWGDYDNDGFPDLFLTNSREDQLYHNEGDGTFTDVTAKAGVAGCFTCYSGSALWWDHDRDGDLDLYVGVLNGFNIMYENKGDGTFEDITQQTRLQGNGIAWSAVALDIGKDGFLDLYVINDAPINNEFFDNRTGTNYDESSRAYRLDNEGSGMGVAVGDYNNDGFFDIYVTNIFNQVPNPLFENTGNLWFKDVAKEMGVENSGWGWGTHFLDYDHDGDEDLFAVDGPIDKLYGDPQDDQISFFFKNMLMEGGTGFTMISEEAGTNHIAKSKGLEVFDYDRDGDLDMLVANQEESPFLYRNELIRESQPTDKNWLQIELEGTTTNRNGFGTEVKFTIGDQSYYRFHHGAGFFGQSIKPVHVGVGSATKIDEIQITWLSGLREAIYDVPVNQILHFQEGSGKEIPKDEEPPVTGPSNEEATYSYPNPFTTTTTLHFELPRSGTLEVKVLSATGQEIYRAIRVLDNGGPVEIPLGDIGPDGRALSAGMYYFVADLGNQIETRRFKGKIVKLGRN